MTSAPLSSIGLVLLSSLLGSIASVFLKAGANHLHRSKESLIRAAIRLIIGGTIFLISSVFYIWGIKGNSLTVLYPLLALGYVWTMLWSRLFFGEPINKTKMAGVSLVLTGAFVIAVGG